MCLTSVTVYSYSFPREKVCVAKYLGLDFRIGLCLFIFVRENIAKKKSLWRMASFSKGVYCMDLSPCLPRVIFAKG